MLFRDLNIGSKFKILNDDRVFTKIAYAGCIGSRDEVPAINYGLYGSDFYAFPTDKKALTLQKVTKTEKKWVKESLGKLEAGKEFRFEGGTKLHTKLWNNTNHNNNNNGEVFFLETGTWFVRGEIDLNRSVEVSEEVKVETEEWV